MSMYKITIEGNTWEEFVSNLETAANMTMSSETRAKEVPAVEAPVAPTWDRAGHTTSAPAVDPTAVFATPYVAPIPATPVQMPPQPQPAPTATVPTQPVAPQYTIDQLSVAAARLMDAGKQPRLMALVQSFGVQSITELKPEQYGAFATALRQEGAQI